MPRGQHTRDPVKSSQEGPGQERWSLPGVKQEQIWVGALPGGGDSKPQE